MKKTCIVRGRKGDMMRDKQVRHYVKRGVGRVGDMPTKPTVLQKGIHSMGSKKAMTCRREKIFSEEIQHKR